LPTSLRGRAGDLHHAARQERRLDPALRAAAISSAVGRGHDERRQPGARVAVEVVGREEGAVLHAVDAAQDRLQPGERGPLAGELHHVGLAAEQAERAAVAQQLDAVGEDHRPGQVRHRRGGAFRPVLTGRTRLTVR
jgi:hypothetical protein